jgi:hypothetical protein
MENQDFRVKALNMVNNELHAIGIKRSIEDLDLFTQIDFHVAEYFAEVEASLEMEMPELADEEAKALAQFIKLRK